MKQHRDTYVCPRTLKEAFGPGATLNLDEPYARVDIDAVVGYAAILCAAVACAVLAIWG